MGLSDTLGCGFTLSAACQAAHLHQDGYKMQTSFLARALPWERLASGGCMQGRSLAPGHATFRNPEHMLYKVTGLETPQKAFIVRKYTQRAQGLHAPGVPRNCVCLSLTHLPILRPCTGKLVFRVLLDPAGVTYPVPRDRFAFLPTQVDVTSRGGTKAVAHIESTANPNGLANANPKALLTDAGTLPHLAAALGYAGLPGTAPALHPLLRSVSTTHWNWC